ncbi:MULTISPECIES: 15,16-dihydrobiliverdin:ferredoxin oxidoreductase [Prochlorococcus]|uniref:15,16-dihydrobiliverdin:ferredoxin oxidoreductase n=1 Tax=Prochlorococcus TaxID=1218 RepID=UPI000533769F|nr:MULTISPECIES: 15,16-dihydrobiliverdin:ferredoxin oxidoreductase [Prochlorococcus]KGG13618.1 15,16-dihydrobiliverdin:ferredoxin oxidoreductase PebA [Prochlorococcus sp. MIT 0601]
MFDTYLEELNSNLKLKNGKLIPLSEGLAECYSLKGKGYIRSWLWSLPGFRRWRVTRMDIAGKLQVLNSVAYPDYANDQPIMGIDLLWFETSKKLVAVMDFQPLVQEKVYFARYYNELKLLKKKYPEFTNQDTVRSYDLNQYFSPWVLLLKGTQGEKYSSLPIVFTSFLQSYFRLFQNSHLEESYIKYNKVKELHISYDIYSAQRDPAHGLFRSYFGKEWADRFLQEFLFPNSIGKDQLDI